jgi:Flp pilus assembly protein TadD/mono/diheme cytochrome c family protein
MFSRPGVSNRAALALAIAGACALGVRAAAPGTAAAASTPLTFYRDVLPIFAAHCVGCHHPGGSGGFDASAYGEVRPRARAVADAVRRRVMPPWKPEPGYGGPFVGERRLQDEQIAIVARWAAEGAAAGDRRDVPPVPATRESSWALGTPDLVLELPQPYLLARGRRDVFRNFVLPIPIDGTRYVKGLEFQPTNPQVTHHANMRVDATRASERLDLSDPEPGYTGFTPSSATFPDGHFLGWTPGQTAPFLGPGMSWRLEPASSLVVQLHLVPGADAAAVGFRVGVYFTDAAPTRTPIMFRLGRQNLDLAPGDDHYAVADRYVLPVDITVHAIQPHAHSLAREIRAFATLPDGSRRWLIFIKDWDFHWQDVYRYEQPIPLPAGTTLEMQYVYDNSARNRAAPMPPRRVRYGQHSSDEMGDLWLQVLLREEKDRGRLLRDYKPKEYAEDVIGHQVMLEASPDSPGLHASLAVSYVRLGNHPAALRHFEEALRLDPTSALAHNNIAGMLAASGRADQAAEHYRSAIALDPQNTFARNGLGVGFLAAGDFPAALTELRAALAIEPRDPQTLNNLGIALQRSGDVTGAIEMYERAAMRAPDRAVLHFNLAGALKAVGRLADAIEAYKRCLQLEPTHERARLELAVTLLRLAWLLPTWSDGRD